MMTFGTSKEGTYFSFEKQPNAQNKTLIFFKNGTITEGLTVKNIR